MIALFTLGLITGILRAFYNYEVWKKVNWHFSQGLFVGVLSIGFISLYQHQLVNLTLN
jgi:hypothetical protein